MTKEELRKIFEEAEQEVNVDIVTQLLEDLKGAQQAKRDIDEADAVFLAFKISKEFNFKFFEKVLRRLEIIP